MKNTAYPNISAFMEKFGTGCSDGFEKGFVSVLTKAEKYAASINKPLTEFTKQDFIGLFNSCKWVASRSSFDTNKMRIIRYLNFLFDAQDAVDTNRVTVINDLSGLKAEELDESALKQKFFASESDFLKYIDSLDEECIVEKIILLLYWVGFTTEAIPSLRRHDIHKGASTIGTISCSAQILSRVIELSERDFYRAKTTGNVVRRFDFEDTDYLVRKTINHVKEGEEGTPILPSTICSRMRRLRERGGKKHVNDFSASSLALNRRFCDDYDYETRTGVELTPSCYVVNSAVNPSERMDTNNKACIYIIKYNQWKRVFHPIPN